MRKASTILDAEDRRAVARGAAAGLGLTTLLALRADWLLASGLLEFRRTGRNVAASLMGLELLPGTLVFTAILAAGTVVVLAQAVRRAPAAHQGSQQEGTSRDGAIRDAFPANG